MPWTSSTPEPEWSVLVAACSEGNRQQNIDRIRFLARTPLRWELLFDLAERHGVQPLLCCVLSEARDLIDTEHFIILQRKYQSNLHKALILSRELIRIVGLLSALGIEVLPYKGLALAEAIYGDIALRQSGDIDLIIRAADLKRVREGVRELGYAPQLQMSAQEERAYLKSGYEYAFDGTAGRNLLEVQWAMQPRFYAVDFDMDGLFRRAVKVSVAGCSMSTPSFEDLFVVLALHAAKHVWGRLIWLCDLARIINRAGLDWNQIGCQARDLGVVRILRVSLLLANQVLGLAIPESAQRNLPQDPGAKELAEQVQLHIANEAAFNVASVAYFRLMLRLREKRMDRVRFLSRLIFTPGPSEWAAVRLPSPLFPLYRVVRIARLATKLVRM